LGLKLDVSSAIPATKMLKSALYKQTTSTAFAYAR
jgi:hypothetical protein